MKRIIIFAVLLVMIAAQASAESLYEMVEGHNRYSVICGAKHIETEPEIEEDRITYKLSENLHDIFLLKDNEMRDGLL